MITDKDLENLDLGKKNNKRVASKITVKKVRITKVSGNRSHEKS